jgi:hypothetical protein
LPGIFGADVVESEQKRLANVGEPLRQIPAGVTHSANMADPENWVNPLRGYAYDSFNPDVLSTATVKNGNVVFESGATYKILVIPGKMKMNPNYLYMSYATVKKLLALIKAGAKVIVADKPLYQPGIKQVNNAEFNSSVEEIWGGSFSVIDSFPSRFDAVMTNIMFRELGKGKIYKASIVDDTFEAMGINPDFFASEKDVIPEGEYAKNVAFAHRTFNNEEIYFISNQENRERVLDLIFNQHQVSPVIYDAVTNQYMQPKHWAGNPFGVTYLDLKFAPNQSLFVIFKKTDTLSKAENGNNWSTFKTIQDISKSWQAKFDTAYAGPAKPVIFNDLTDWTTSTDSLVKYYSGTAVYAKKFTFNGDFKAKTWIDLGAFTNIAEVKINGINCGTLWTAPYRLDISNAIKNGENQITIEVTNTWANRLIGDSKLPENKRITKTTAPFRLEGKPLNPAGLLGPVTIQREEK